jgi:hypothetical protein
MYRPTGVLVEGQEGKRPLGRPRHRCENNIKMDLQEVGWGGKDRVDLAEDGRQVAFCCNTVMKLRKISCLAEELGFSRTLLHGVP